MNAKIKKIDELNVELTIEVAAADYAEAEKKKLNDCRRKAEFKGFRKGMVPPALIKKVYGGQCLADAVNEVLSQQLQETIEKENLNILGEPLTGKNQPEITWESGNDFTFVFDLGLSPKFELDPSASDTVTSYEISLAASEKKNAVESLRKYYDEKKEGEKKTDEEIEKEVTERMETNLKQEAEWKLSSDIRNYLVGKAGIKLPEEFLKRWLTTANEGKVTAEQVEKEFPGFIEDFKWQMVRGYLMKKYELKVEKDDLTAAAEAFVTYQYTAYGLGNVPADLIKEAAQNMLSDKQQIERLYEQVEDQKVMAKIRETITIKSKKIASDKFHTLK